MSPETKEALSMLWPGVSLLANVWMWLTMRKIEAQKASEIQMKSWQDATVKVGAEHAVRLVRLETAAKAVPTKEELSRIHQRMDEVERVLHELVGKSEAANHTLQLINQYLLNNGGGKS